MNVMIKRGFAVLSLITSAGQIAHANAYTAPQQPVGISQQSSPARSNRQDNDRIFAAQAPMAVPSPETGTPGRFDRWLTAVQGGNNFNWMAGGGG